MESQLTAYYVCSFSFEIHILLLLPTTTPRIVLIDIHDVLKTRFRFISCKKEDIPTHILFARYTGFVVYIMFTLLPL